MDQSRPSWLAQLYWRAYYYLLRAAVGAGFFALGLVGAKWIGIGLMAPVVICAAAVVCGLVAMLLGQGGGKVSYVNRLAVIVLPLGLRAGGGRLMPLFAWSAGLWSAVGMAGAVVAGVWARETTRAPALRVVLVASLLVDGAAFVMLTKQAVTRLTLTSARMKPVAVMLAGLMALMGGGIGLWMADLPWAAVLVAGGPPVIVAGIYGVLLVVMMGSSMH
jgi:hypothetical protein